MTNKVSFFIDIFSVESRQSEVPAANFYNGANSNACLGITTDISGIDEKDWTLLDQAGHERTPQLSQILGGVGYPVGIGSSEPDGFVLREGNASMPDQIAWVASLVPFDASAFSLGFDEGYG